MTIIGLKELRQNASQIAERALNGERFTVVKRSKPVFSIVPPQTDSSELDTWLENYIAQNRTLLVSLKDK